MPSLMSFPLQVFPLIFGVTTEEEALERLAEGKECGEIFCLDNGIMLQLDLSAC